MSQAQIISIGSLTAGVGCPPLIMAEIGNNPAGNRDLAGQMVQAAARAGAHLVKFQTYDTDFFLSRGNAAYEEFRRERLDYADQLKLFDLAESLGLEALSTPFDLNSLDFLIQNRRPALKIASGDLTNLPLLRAAAKSGLPVILSTGAGQWDEIAQALDILDPRQDRSVLLLHCTVAYPARDVDADLWRLRALLERFGRPVGFSDHTLGIEIALAAVALGAVLVEKHFTIDRSLAGGDNAMSILPQELSALCTGSARIFKGLGLGHQEKPADENLLQLIRRSPATLCDIAPGELIDLRNTALVRPGSGLTPAQYENLIGRKARVKIPKGAQLRLEWVD